MVAPALRLRPSLDDATTVEIFSGTRLIQDAPRVSRSGSVRKPILSEAKINGASIIDCIPTIMRSPDCTTAIIGDAKKNILLFLLLVLSLMGVQYSEGSGHHMGHVTYFLIVAQNISLTEPEPLV